MLISLFAQKSDLAFRATPAPPPPKKKKETSIEKLFTHNELQKSNKMEFILGLFNKLIS